MSNSVPLGKSFYKYIFFILLVLIFPLRIFSDSKEIQFLRTTDTALQTSVYTLISKDTNVRLKIIGVLHIADLEYYQNIQKIINDLDYLFYEGIQINADKTISRYNHSLSSIASEIDANQTKKSIRKNSEFKNEIARFLNFADQLEHLKPKQNWINADMNFSQFMNVLSSNQVGFDSIANNLSAENRSIVNDYLELKQLEPTTPDYNEKVLNFKKKMSQNLVKSCQDLCFLEETKLQRTAIITERNKVAISIVKPKFTSQVPLELGLLYGAAHTPNFVEILTHEYNFEIESYEWLDAWSLQN